MRYRRHSAYPTMMTSIKRKFGRKSSNHTTVCQLVSKAARGSQDTQRHNEWRYPEDRDADAIDQAHARTANTPSATASSTAKPCFISSAQTR